MRIVLARLGSVVGWCGSVAEMRPYPGNAENDEPDREDANTSVWFHNDTGSSTCGEKSVSSDTDSDLQA